MLYRFRTFRTSYFFPKRIKETEFLYGIYHAYGGKLSKIYWWLFQHCGIVRFANRVPNPNKYFPYRQVVGLCPPGSVLSLNMGTPGVEQKMSMLGLAPDGTRFFAKYSIKPKTLLMSKNEINVLEALNGTGLAPDLLDFKVEDDYVFFRTSYVNGVSLASVSLSDKITDLAIELSKYHLKEKNNTELKYCLSHGDFTPWNVMVVNGEYRLIDWELADERPLGYDLFLYISHFNDDSQLLDAYLNARHHIDRYFTTHGICDWSPYLYAFAQLKAKYENEKGESARSEFYKGILKFKL